MTKEEVWQKISSTVPVFRPEHDISDNFRAVQEILLGGSLTWCKAHEYFQPKNGMTVLDIGANAGIYSAYCGAHGAQVLAFEPGRNSFALLSKMTELSGLQRFVYPIKAALSSRNGMALTLEHRIENGALPYFNGGLETAGVKWGTEDFAKAEWVPTLDLRSVVSNLSHEIDCMKMDVEGAEAEILSVTPQWILRKIKFMYIEIHDWMGLDLYTTMLDHLKATCDKVDGYTNPQTGLFEALYVKN
jgi:FkbM family methyltransferase